MNWQLAWPTLIDRAERYRRHPAAALDAPWAYDLLNVVVCQQRLQRFPEGSRSLSEMRQVLVPGGRVAVAVWGPIQRSPAFAALADSLERHAGFQVAAAVRWLFSLSDPDDLRAFLADAGFDGIRVQTAHKTTRFPSVAEFLRRYVPRVPGRPRYHPHVRERQAQGHRRSRDRPGRLGRLARADDHDGSQHGVARDADVLGTGVRNRRIWTPRWRH